MPKEQTLTADQMTDTETPKLPPKQSSDTVKVKVTKFGGGKVSTGIHVAAEGDIMAQPGEVIEVAKSVAAALESFGLAEIQE